MRRQLVRHRTTRETSQQMPTMIMSPTCLQVRKDLGARRDQLVLRVMWVLLGRRVLLDPRARKDRPAR